MLASEEKKSGSENTYGGKESSSVPGGFVGTGDQDEFGVRISRPGWETRWNRRVREPGHLAKVFFIGVIRNTGAYHNRCELRLGCRRQCLSWTCPFQLRDTEIPFGISFHPLPIGTNMHGLHHFAVSASLFRWILGYGDMVEKQSICVYSSNMSDDSNKGMRGKE